jgi:DNA-binding CsgD family transcriptional regulator
LQLKKSLSDNADSFIETADERELERRRIAAEIERQIIAPLNLLVAQAGLYEQTMGTNPQARLVASVLTTLARQVIRQAHDLQADLYPTVLADLGLAAALEMALNRLGQRGVATHFTVSGKREQLSSSQEFIIYRTFQNILQNLEQGGLLRLNLRLEYTATDVGLDFRYRGGELPADLDLPPDCIVERDPNYLKITFATSVQDTLTVRELEVLRQLAEGLSNKEIAGRLNLSSRTINFHLDNIYTKLDVNSRTEALVKAIKRGLLP